MRFANLALAASVSIGITMATPPFSPAQDAATATRPARVPVIDCTDLYHPFQDVGDNFDLLAAYAAPEVDLRAIVLDVTDRFRQTPDQRPDADPNLFPADPGARDPGFIPALQCNYIFGRNVPVGVTPFAPLRSTDDRADDAPAFQQVGVTLLLDALRASDQHVHGLVFGSCRAVAIALNREPELMRAKVRRVHLCVGTSSGEAFDIDWQAQSARPLAPGSAGFIEWNVALDPHAFVRVLRSDLPLAIYPCASENGPFRVGRHNVYFALPSLAWVTQMQPRLGAYLGYAFTRSTRSDYLRAVDGPMDAAAEQAFAGHGTHHVWETPVWIEVTGRKLVRRADGTCRILPAHEVRPDDEVVAGGLTPCRITRVDATGRFAFELTDGPSNTLIFDRGPNPDAHADALREALPAWYLGFR
jgi:pyrimidine-specific ribonucleoside hydrolase